MRKLPVLIVLSLALLAAATAAQARTPRVWDTAPEFELTLVNRQKVKLADLRGQVIVLNFWGDLVRTLPRGVTGARRVLQGAEEARTEVFAITTENSVPEKKLRDLFNAMTIEPIHKLKGPYTYIGNAVPTNFVIDRTGKVRYAKAGAFNLQQLNDILIPLLKEAPPASAEIALPK